MTSFGLLMLRVKHTFLCRAHVYYHISMYIFTSSREGVTWQSIESGND
jgi:hypothetical protein